jgi:hypothetical protein
MQPEDVSPADNQQMQDPRSQRHNLNVLPARVI